MNAQQDENHSLHICEKCGSESDDTLSNEIDGLYVCDVCFRKYKKDFVIENHGSIVLVRPLTQAAKDWLAKHTPAGNDHQYWGRALVVEPRYLENLLDGIGADGLSV